MQTQFPWLYFRWTQHSASVQDLKFFHLVSNAKEKHLFRFLHLMCFCFGSPSVTWLRLGSMWCLWPFLTLTEGCCDQLCGRLSVSHWGLVFKWRAWRWCQDCYTQYVQKYQKNVTWILLLSPGWDVFNSDVSFLGWGLLQHLCARFSHSPCRQLLKLYRFLIIAIEKLVLGLGRICSP